MSAVLLVNLLFTTSLLSPGSHATTTKASLLSIAKSIECVHKAKDFWDSLIYADYGCWCGVGKYDTDETADDIDECCKTHDRCYDQLSTSESCSQNLNSMCRHVLPQDYQTYCKSYQWRCTDDNEPECDNILMADDPCAQQLCACDAEAMKCFAASSSNVSERATPMCDVHRKKNSPTSSTTSCCNDIGCFPFGANSGFEHLFFEPECPDEQQLSLYFFTPEKQAPQIVEFSKLDANVETISIDVSRNLYVLIHGFANKGDQWPQPLFTTMQVYLNKMDCNVIMVNWVEGAKKPNYLQAASNTRAIGAAVAHFLNSLVLERGLDSMNIHLVGHSLGAHVAGFAGERLRSISRIIGLDPAGPLFERQDVNARLDSSDADFVQVLHTNSAQLGIFRPIGHIDFYANDGQQQPGCQQTNILKAMICSHTRAIELFTQSIQNSKNSCQCRFVAFLCNSAQDWYHCDI